MRDSSVSLQDISKDVQQHYIGTWKEDLLCQYILDRLFSFSILTARVFAVGHPAHHSQGGAHKCM
uniref:Uncharacterized protein n=1 Tax=Hippocampus comes TaxID=109280 RepID=A0A3Q2XN73_HIPCM